MGTTPPSPSHDHFKAIIAYDGTDFYGFQIQAQERTVQGTLETVLQTIARTPVRVIGAGRTDAGVHAIGQVIAFWMPWRHPPADLQNALNANLPPDIVVQHLTTAQPNFHPRFDAHRRQYRYTILNQPLPDVLRRRYTAHIAPPLQMERMQQASRLLLGTHDFAAFGRPPQGSNTVRTITQAQWQANGPELTFTITANAFLYRMVRNIVGTLIQVGLGRLNVEDVQTILQTRDRAAAGPPAPAAGLCLTRVIYQDETPF